jgi:phage-related protein (TIGR01555 family)
MNVLSLIETIGTAIRADGWENAVLGLGGTKDPSAYTTYASRGRLNDDLLEALYIEDHFAARIIEAVVRAGMRPGWDLAVEGNPAETSAIASAYRAREDELGVAEELAQGACWGRLFGGALTWIGVDDRRPSALELDESRIEAIRFLHTFDRRDVQVHRYYYDPTHPKFGRPESYTVRSQVRNVGGIGAEILAARGSIDPRGIVIHESRCIVWPGQATTDARRAELSGWDDSVLERCWDALKQVAEDFGAKSLILGRISQAVYKIKNLYGMIAGKQEGVLRTRMGMMDASRSRARAIVLDTNEEFVNVAQPVAGVDGMIEKSVLRLASAADMPVTVLMKQSPAGFDATGDGDLEQWAETCDTWRTQDLRPRHERITRMILLEKDGPTKGIEPDKWEIRYRALRVPKPEKIAELRKAQADTYAVWIDKGLTSAEALAVKVFSPGSGLSEITLDETDLKAALERRKLLANQPPKDNAELGTVGARDGALQSLQEAFYDGRIPEEAALARLELVFRFGPDDAKRLLARPTGWAPPAPAAPPSSGPGPLRGPPNGEGAGAPQGLPGFNAGGDPRETAP